MDIIQLLQESKEKLDNINNKEIEISLPKEIVDILKNNQPDPM